MSIKKQYNTILSYISSFDIPYSIRKKLKSELDEKYNNTVNDLYLEHFNNNYIEYYKEYFKKFESYSYQNFINKCLTFRKTPLFLTMLAIQTVIMLLEYAVNIPSIISVLVGVAFITTYLVVYIKDKKLFLEQHIYSISLHLILLLFSIFKPLFDIGLYYEKLVGEVVKNKMLLSANLLSFIGVIIIIICLVNILNIVLFKNIKSFIIELISYSSIILFGLFSFIDVKAMLIISLILVFFTVIYFINMKHSLVKNKHLYLTFSSLFFVVMATIFKNLFAYLYSINQFRAAKFISYYMQVLSYLSDLVLYLAIIALICVVIISICKKSKYQYLDMIINIFYVFIFIYFNAYFITGSLDAILIAEKEFINLTYYTFLFLAMSIFGYNAYFKKLKIV